MIWFVCVVESVLILLSQQEGQMLDFDRLAERDSKATTGCTISGWNHHCFIDMLPL